MQTCNGEDTANLRHTEKSAQWLKLNVAEEQSLDEEIRHTTEDIGYLALNSQTRKGVYAVNSGGSVYTDFNRVSYSIDENFTYGTKAGTSSSISRTEDDPVFQKLSYGDFSYDIPLQNGDYKITLQFVKTSGRTTITRSLTSWPKAMKSLPTWIFTRQWARMPPTRSLFLSPSRMVS